MFREEEREQNIQIYIYQVQCLRMVSQHEKNRNIATKKGNKILILHFFFSFTNSFCL